MSPITLREQVDPAELMTAHTAAKLLDVSIRTVRSYMADGTLPVIRLQVPKRAVRVRRRDVDALRSTERPAEQASQPAAAVGATS